MEGIKTVTRDGIENHFEGIQVISKVEKSELINLVKKYGLEFRDALIHDRIKEELLGYCSNHTIDEVCKRILCVLVSTYENGRLFMYFWHLIFQKNICKN